MSEDTVSYYLPIKHSFVPKDAPSEESSNQPRAAFEFVKTKIALEGAVNQFNEYIQKRGGIVLADGQILSKTFSMSDVLDYGIELIELNTTQEFERREWGAQQKEYFNIENPYQHSEDVGEYGYGWILIDSREPFLKQEERIVALLHGEKDKRPFYCPCHHAQVVYTSNRRFVCMVCGMLHCVLENPIKRNFKCSMSSEEWLDYFGQDGTKQEEEIDIDIIDFQDIENSHKIWTTHQYEEAASELIFFSRSSAEELEEYYRTSLNPGALIEAGFSVVHQIPEPIFQIGRFSHDIDKVTNAMSSLEEGAIAYQKGKTQSTYIKFAALHLFHTIELILKIRLEQEDAKALAKNPNNPTVIKMVQQKGVYLSADELKTINSLRTLRNSFQHDEASFNYRKAASLLRESIIFIDRFTADELGIWTAEEIRAEAWQMLLNIDAVRTNAERITNEVLKQVRGNTAYEISTCPRCKAEALVAEVNQGSLCIYCRHRPTLDELESISSNP